MTSFLLGQGWVKVGVRQTFAEGGVGRQAPAHPAKPAGQVGQAVRAVQILGPVLPLHRWPPQSSGLVLALFVRTQAGKVGGEGGQPGGLVSKCRMMITLVPVVVLLPEPVVHHPHVSDRHVALLGPTSLLLSSDWVDGVCALGERVSELVHPFPFWGRDRSVGPGLGRPAAALLARVGVDPVLTVTVLITLELVVLLDPLVVEVLQLNLNK